MAERMEIIPAIDLLDGRVVRLLRGRRETVTVYSDDPVAVARQWERDGADRIHVVDLNAAFGGGDHREVIASICRNVNIPVQVAGGIRSADAARDRASWGAASLVLGTMVFSDAEGTKALSAEFGPSRIIAALDHLEGVIRTKGWTTSTGIRLDTAIHDLLGQGIDQVLITAIDRDGAMNGPDLATLGPLCADTRFRIIASGGVATAADVSELQSIGASGVIIGKALYEKQIRLSDLTTPYAAR